MHAPLAKPTSAGLWRPIRLSAILRLVERRWIWFRDPARGNALLLQSPGGRIYWFRSHPDTAVREIVSRFRPGVSDT